MAVLVLSPEKHPQLEGTFIDPARRPPQNNRGFNNRLAGGGAFQQRGVVQSGQDRDAGMY